MKFFYHSSLNCAFKVVLYLLELFSAGTGKFSLNHRLRMIVRIDFFSIFAMPYIVHSKALRVP